MTVQYTILAVDDTSESLSLLVAVLSDAGYRARPADSGELALAAVAADPPDLILLDVRMPGLDGIEVCRRLKAREETRDIPIILVSASGELDERVQGFRLGAADYVVKPFQPEELLARIASQLALSETRRALEQQATELRKAGENLQLEIEERQRVEAALREALERAERSRRAVLSVLEDQRQATASLLESDARFQQLFDNMAEGVAVYEAVDEGQDFFFADLNRTGQIVSKVSLEEVLGRRVTDVFPDLERTGLLDVFRRVWRTGRPERHPLTLYADGRLEAWVEYYVFRLPSGLIVAIYADTSERHRAEDALRQSEERHRTMLEAGLDGILLVDASTRLLEVNDAYCRMSGYTRDELLTMRIPELHPVDEAATVVVQLREIMQRGWGRFECLHLRKDGSAFHVELGVRYSPTDGGRAIAFVRDITERKRAEAERLRLDEQLRQSQKMEAVGQLAGGVAHDLNNMLGVINGYAEMTLQDLQQSDRLYADISEIKKAGDRSAQLTRQLLAFARRQAIAPKVLDLNDALAAMLKMLSRLVGENVSLVWKPGARVWPVKVDPGQVDQILANLVVNARDAIAGVGTVTIETQNAELDEVYCRTHIGSEPGSYVSIGVTDDGCGMGPDILEHIFEPFFTTKAVGQGTGLGLATVYGIVKQNGGNTYVTSEPGKGTTFRVYLPRHVPEGAAVETDRELAGAPRGTETVLLVEDEVALLELCRRVLGQLGYTVLSANTPHEALRLAAAHQGEIDLLLTDVVMPGMGGRQLQEILTSAHPEVKYLFMSGYAAGALNQQGVLDTDPRLLQKPFTREQLARRVRAALDER